MECKLCSIIAILVLPHFVCPKSCSCLTPITNPSQPFISANFLSPKLIVILCSNILEKEDVIISVTYGLVGLQWVLLGATAAAVVTREPGPHAHPAPSSLPHQWTAFPRTLPDWLDGSPDHGTKDLCVHIRR